MRKLIFTFVILAFVSSVRAQWVQMPNGMGTGQIVTSLAVSGNNIFAGTNVNGVYLSTNNGSSWMLTDLNRNIYSLAALGGIIWAGTGNGIYNSTNNGNNWTLISTPMNSQDVMCLVIFGNDIFAGTFWNGGNHGVYHSSNNGSSWTYCGLNGETPNSFAKLNSTIFAGTKESKIYLSTNNGTNFTQTSFNYQCGEIYALATLGNNIFAGADSGIYVSNNYGTSWTQNAFYHQQVTSFAITGSNIFAGVPYDGVYLSTNNGTNWIAKSQGFTGSPLVKTILISNNYIYAGMWGQSIWRRPIAEMIGIKNISTEIPAKYSLSQNYPNPFNPTTKIKFDVVRLGDVKIVVYDIMGREVLTLVNESMQPGTYETTFDASSLSSGIYFYTLTAGDFKESKRMIFIK